jgi:hypothetical protein
MIDRGLSKQVGPQAFELSIGKMFGDTLAVQYINVALKTQGFEIRVGKKVDIRRIIPLVRKLFGDGHATAKIKVGSGAPVAKVGEGDNALFTDTQHFIQY